MTLAAVRHPTPVASGLGRWDSRWKLLAVLVAAFSVALTRGWPAAWVAFGLAVGLAAVARVPRRWYVRRLSALSVGLLPFLVILPLTLDGGVATAAGIAGRALAIGSLALTLTASEPLHRTCAAAHALGVPGVLVHVTVLTYRYVFLIAEELRRLDTALRARGFRNRFDAHSFRTVGRVTGALLVRGNDRAERVAQAMTCRGFDGHFRTLTHFHTSLRDVSLFVILCLTALGLLLGDWWWRGWTPLG